MAKLMTNAQIKKAIQGCEQDELIELILKIAQSCQQAREYLALNFTENQEEILGKYKQKVKDEFFPKRGFGRLNLREAKKAIADYKKICPDRMMVIDIMLFYVENCVAFTNEYGDINETFYNSAINVYSDVVKEINTIGAIAYERFAARLDAAAHHACHGWGFYDAMIDLYHEIEFAGGMSSNFDYHAMTQYSPSRRRNSA